ncbi:acyl-CoA dehydrogenase family protein, partial [Oceanicola sp. 22II-s10i]|uniref:acyl-CoA dehydrogenase family protein n=1 Tax=Oceanicola sp. 22II-s10i TaxID=1317116 RepID=UPI001130DF1F
MLDGAMAEMVERFAADKVTREGLQAAERGDWPADLWQELDGLGLPRGMLDGEDGGAELSPAEAVEIVRLLGRHALPVPLGDAMVTLWIARRAGLTPPDGYVAPATAARATLSREGEGFRLSGQAARVPWGGEAAALLVSAELDGAPMLALLPAAALSVTPGTNMARERRDTLDFDTVLDASTVAAAPEGFGPEGLLLIGAAVRTAGLAGAMERALEMTVAYAQERVQFGKPIA